MISTTLTRFIHTFSRWSYAPLRHRYPGGLVLRVNQRKTLNFSRCWFHPTEPLETQHGRVHHKIPSTYMAFTFLVSQQKIIEILATSEILGSIKKRRLRTCPAVLLDFFFYSFTSSNSRSANSGALKGTLCLGDASNLEHHWVTMMCFVSLTKKC